MSEHDLCTRRVEICGAMGLDPRTVAESAFAGHPTIYESVPVLDAAGRGSSIISFDASGGFLLEGISARTRGAILGAETVPQFQIIDASRNRPLFSDLVHNQMFHELGPYNANLDQDEDAPSGYSIGRLPRPYFFRPSSDLVIQHVNHPGQAKHDVYLHGWRFRGCGGPQIPDARFEPYIYRVRPTYDAGAATARATALVEQGQRFTLTQVCIVPSDENTLANTQRIQITDARLTVRLFDQAMPLNLFAATVGPYWKLHNPYTFLPTSSIQIDLQDIDVEALGYGLYLIGWREWLSGGA
jgi:hypothetical protein